MLRAKIRKFECAVLKKEEKRKENATKMGPFSHFGEKVKILHSNSNCFFIFKTKNQKTAMRWRTDKPARAEGEFIGQNPLGGRQTKNLYCATEIHIPLGLYPFFSM